MLVADVIEVEFSDHPCDVLVMCVESLFFLFFGVAYVRIYNVYFEAIVELRV